MKLFKSWKRTILKSLQLQLFISFISLPFLIAWGLPISILTPISTLIFSPFLTLFLLISSLIFFLELVYLPNNMFIWCLEHVTYYWNICLNLEQRSWLIAFKKPPACILVLIPLLAIAIIHHKKIINPLSQISWLASSLFIMCCILKLFPLSSSTMQIETIPCNPGAITIISHNNTIFVIDSGCISGRSSFETTINYTFIPMLIKKTGSLHIDCLIIKKINQRILEALCFLASKITIQKIYMPYWREKIPYRAWLQYIQLKKQLEAHSGTIIRLSKSHILLKTNNTHISLDQHPTSLCYYDATYNPLIVHKIVDNCATII